MACPWEILLNAGQFGHGAPAVAEAFSRVNELEDQLTVYREDSEVMDLNRYAGEESIEVEEGLFGLLGRAVLLAKETGGAFDITAGPLSKVWGFFRRQGAIPTEEDLQEALGRVGSHFIDLDVATQSVRLTHPELELNLGSIGKGYAVDEAGDVLLEWGITDFLIHGGTSSIQAVGSRWYGNRLEGWTVGLRNPLNPQQQIGQLTLQNRSMGTSGKATQFFRHQGKRYGHILDPRTGWPAEQVTSVTVTAPTAEQADALATAFFVLGPEPTRAYLQQYPQVAALIVTPASGTRVLCEPINFPEGELLLDEAAVIV